MEEVTSIDKTPVAEPVAISEAHEGEKAQPSPVNNTLQKREDGTDYPLGLKLFLIILALCLSVFLMALGIQAFFSVYVAVYSMTNFFYRQFYHRDCYSQDHGPIQQLRRCRLVR